MAVASAPALAEKLDLSRNLRLLNRDDLDMAALRISLSAKLATIGLAAALFGCNDSSEIVASPEAPVITPAAIAAEASPTPIAGELAAPVVPASLAEEPAEPIGDPATATAEGEAEKPVDALYAPPFPDRVDLFVPPKRQGGVVLKEGGTEDAVELLGFIRLDKQQVVLSVNGQLTRIAEGDTQYGIEVISIQPPEVVLQRGRQRWQASLEK